MIPNDRMKGKYVIVTDSTFKEFVKNGAGDIELFDSVKDANLTCVEWKLQDVLIMKVINNYVDKAKEDAKFEIALDQASFILNTPVNIIKSKSQVDESVNGRRMVAGYLNLMFKSYNPAVLGRLMDRDRSTIITLLKRHKEFLEVDEKYQRDFGLMLRRTNAILKEGMV